MHPHVGITSLPDRCPCSLGTEPVLCFRICHSLCRNNACTRSHPCGTGSCRYRRWDNWSLPCSSPFFGLLRARSFLELPAKSLHNPCSSPRIEIESAQL